MDTAPIFNRISRNYDTFNHLFSMNIDKRWRKSAVRSLCKKLSNRGKAPQESRVLDVACGTGDLTLLLAKAGYSVIGADISEGMLDIAKKRIASASISEPKPTLVNGNCEALPFDNESFDAVTIGYGIRNFDNRPAALKELLRVLKKGGELMILEFGEPHNSFVRFFYKLYFKYVIPNAAAALTLGKERGAYKSFISSVEKFPKFEKFCEEISSAGFSQASYKRQTGGISVIYSAVKE